MFFLFEMDQEKVFGEVLGRKVAILVYENNNFKKRAKSKRRVTPWFLSKNLDFFHLFF